MCVFLCKPILWKTSYEALGFKAAALCGLLPCLAAAVSAEELCDDKLPDSFYSIFGANMPVSVLVSFLS